MISVSAQADKPPVARSDYSDLLVDGDVESVRVEARGSPMSE